MVDARDGLRLTRLTGRKAFVLAKVRPRATRWRIMPRGQRSVVPTAPPAAAAGEVDDVPGRGRVLRRQPADDAAAAEAHSPRSTAARCGRSRSTPSTCCPSTATCRASSHARSPPSGRPRRSAPRRWRRAPTPRSSGRTATSYYDICDTSPARSTAESRTSTRRPTPRCRATAGRVVLYQGQPAFTQFSSSNGGYSSAGSQPYLVAQPDPYEASSDNPNDPWTATVTSAQIEKTWPRSAPSPTCRSPGTASVDFGGRVTSVTLTGSLGGLPAWSGHR